MVDRNSQNHSGRWSRYRAGRPSGRTRQYNLWENTGVLAVARYHDPSVIRITAVFAMILESSGRVRRLYNQYSTSPVTGGISIVLYGIVSAVGVRILINSRLNFGNSRNLLVAAYPCPGYRPRQHSVYRRRYISGLALAAVDQGIFAALAFLGRGRCALALHKRKAKRYRKRQKNALLPVPLQFAAKLLVIYFSFIGVMDNV